MCHLMNIIHHKPFIFFFSVGISDRDRILIACGRIIRMVLVVV